MIKGKILIMLLVILLVGGGVFAATLLMDDGGTTSSAPATIYEIANNSTATAVTTKIAYAGADGGEDFDGWYVAKRDGNNMIVEYEYNRFRTVEESVADGNTDRIVEEKGVAYYFNGKYYNGGDDTVTPWVDLPLDIKFSFNISQDKLTNIKTPDINSLKAEMTAEACREMFGIDISAEGPIALTIITNGIQLTEVEISYTTDSGASVTIRTTYSYNDLTLDFTPITGGDGEQE